MEAGEPVRVSAVQDLTQVVAAEMEGSEIHWKDVVTQGGDEFSAW